MIRAISKAYKRGFRAGMAEHPYYIHGGQRIVKRLSRPLNPYSSPFTPRWRPILALAWDSGAHEGLKEKILTFLNKRRAYPVKTF